MGSCLPNFTEYNVQGPLSRSGCTQLEAWKARQARGKLATQQIPLTSTQKSPPVESVPAVSNGHRIVEARLQGSQGNDAELDRRAKALPEARDTSTSSGADGAEPGGSGKATYLPKPPPPRPVFMRPPPFQPRQATAPPSDLIPARDGSPATVRPHSRIVSTLSAIASKSWQPQVQERLCLHIQVAVKLFAKARPMNQPRSQQDYPE